MQKNSLISLANKVGIKERNKKPGFFYQKLKSDFFYKMIFDSLTPEEIALFCFICSQISMGVRPNEIKQLINNISGNLFTFSLIEVTDEDPYVECGLCMGSGEINYNYDTILCKKCNGSGEVEKEGFYSITVDEFISYDSDIFYSLELLDELDEMNQDIVNSIYDSELTFVSKRYYVDTDILKNKYPETGMYYFGTFDKVNIKNWRKSSDIETNLKKF